MTDESKTAWTTFTQEMDVAGHQLVAEVNRLAAEGNVRRLQIKTEKGDVFLAVPLTAGAVAGGVVAIAAPWLAVIGAIAGLVAKVKLEVVREAPPDAAPPAGNSDDPTPGL